MWQWAVLAAACLVCVPLFRYMFDCMCAKFGDPREDMAHGWLVPAVCLAFIWSRRRDLRAAKGAPSWAGAGFVLAGLCLYWIGNNGEQYRICQVAFSLLIWAVPYALWGSGVARLLAFPAAYFLFTVPFAFLDFFTIRLRMLAAGVATGLLNGVGLTVTRVGTAIHSTAGSGFGLDVADPCSGLRSLFAMIALTTAYAYYTQKTTAGKWLLFASAVPIAVIGNICRIVSICVVAWVFGQEAASGFYHDYSGYVVFLVGVLLMMQVGGLLDRLLQRRPGAGPEQVGPAVAVTRSSAWGWAPAAVVLAAFLGVWGLKSRMGQPYFETADFVATALPERVGEFAGDQPWFCQNEQCLQVSMQSELLRKGQHAPNFVCPSCGGPLDRVSLAEQKLLAGEARMLKRTYRAPDGLTYSVNVVMTGRSHSTIHRPELCLPTQGYSMEAARVVELKPEGLRPLETRAIHVRYGQSPPFTLLYWFSNRTYETSSHSKRVLANLWDRSVHNRMSRWIMVSVLISSPLESDEAVRRFEAFLSEWYPQVHLGGASASRPERSAGTG